jgi:hypothetical protein
MQGDFKLTAVWKIVYYEEDEKTGEETYYTTGENFNHSWLCDGIFIESLVKCDENGENYDQKEWESK